jgi:hypothetical protein
MNETKYTDLFQFQYLSDVFLLVCFFFSFPSVGISNTCSRENKTLLICIFRFRLQGRLDRLLIINVLCSVL